MRRWAEELAEEESRYAEANNVEDSSMVVCLSHGICNGAVDDDTSRRNVVDGCKMAANDAGGNMAARDSQGRGRTCWTWDVQRFDLFQQLAEK